MRGVAVLFFCGVSVLRAALANDVPRYDHILIIIAENHGFDQIIDQPYAPNINQLAATYGLATNYYGVAHPSQPNYIAIIGGDTFGIRDDDAWYCHAGNPDPYCSSQHSIVPYVNHTVTERSLVDQLSERNLTWKGYYESIPAAGATSVYFPDTQHPLPDQPYDLYAAKHNGFLSFRSVQTDPNLLAKVVGFDQLIGDLASGQIPNYSHIVPNQCNDMHGLSGLHVPDDCRSENAVGRVTRGDAVIGELVRKIKASPIWSSTANVAIVITWDEDDGPHGQSDSQANCGFEAANPTDSCGGHIATIVITNHGVRGIRDPTPYNHYSLLRTTEAAFGIDEYLRHANDAHLGLHTMTPLFQIN